MKNDHEKELDTRTLYFVGALIFMVIIDYGSCVRIDRQDTEIEKLKVWDHAVTHARRDK